MERCSYRQEVSSRASQADAAGAYTGTKEINTIERLEKDLRDAGVDPSLWENNIVSRHKANDPSLNKAEVLETQKNLYAIRNDPDNNIDEILKNHPSRKFPPKKKAPPTPDKLQTMYNMLNDIPNKERVETLRKLLDSHGIKHDGTELGIKEHF